MSNLKDYVKLTAEFTRLTQKEEIKWLKKPALNYMSSYHRRVEYVYTTKYKDRYLRIYEESYRIYNEEGDYDWDSRIVFELVDAEGNNLWTFPYINGIRELFDAIKYKDANVAEFIKDVIG
jgi:hypothetical protein